MGDLNPDDVQAQERFRMRRTDYLRLGAEEAEARAHMLVVLADMEPLREPTTDRLISLLQETYGRYARLDEPTKELGGPPPAKAVVAAMIAALILGACVVDQGYTAWVLNDSSATVVVDAHTQRHATRGCAPAYLWRSVRGERDVERRLDCPPRRWAMRTASGVAGRRQP